MKTFNVGDIVTCVDNKHFESIIIIGQSYTVTNIDDHHELVFLEGSHDWCAFSYSRFVLGSKPISPFQQWEKEYA